MEEREEELKKLFRDELESVRNSQKTFFTEKVSKLEKQFQNHQQEFMMIQQMNDANSMQHEEARRQELLDFCIVKKTTTELSVFTYRSGDKLVKSVFSAFTIGKCIV